MKHARKDYNRIQDPEHRIPEDEPVFLLRGQDRAAQAAIAAWIVSAAKMGASKEILLAANDQSQAMAVWQKEHSSKVPDLPEVPSRTFDPDKKVTATLLMIEGNGQTSGPIDDYVVVVLKKVKDGTDGVYISADTYAKMKPKYAFSALSGLLDIEKYLLDMIGDQLDTRSATEEEVKPNV